MISVKVNETLKGKNAVIKKGISSKGEYFLVNKKAEKGYDKLTIWASNPGDLQSAKAVKVNKIIETRYGHKQNPKDGNWYPEVSMVAELVAVEVDDTDNTAAAGEYWAKAPEGVDDIFNLNF